MSSRLLLILFISSAFVGINSCTYNKEDELYAQACDTTSVTYNNQVKEILKTHCLNCHGNDIFLIEGGRKNLEGYENAKSSYLRILSRVIDENNPMPPPPNYPRLSSCKIDQIRAWINQGLKE